MRANHCISKYLTSFYGIVSFLALCAIAILVFLYMQHVPSFTLSEPTTASQTVLHANKAALSDRDIWYLKRKRLSRSQFTYPFTYDGNLPAYYHILSKYCFDRIEVNGQKLNIPQLEKKGCEKKKFKLDFTRHEGLLKLGENTLTVSIYHPKHNKPKVEVWPLVKSKHLWLIYIMAGVLVGWGTLLMGFTIFKQKAYQQLFSFSMPHYAMWALLLTITSAALLLRMHYLPVVSHDMRVVLLRWYGEFQAHGFSALKIKFYDYAPLYLYLMGFVEWLFPKVPPIHAIKLISIMADLLAALIAFNIVKSAALRFANLAALLTFTAVLFSPMVYINSAMWGQCDVLHSALILLSLYGFLHQRFFLAMMAFALAMCFKLQAIFFAPVIIILWLHYKFHWSYLLLPFAAYAISVVPAAMFSGDVFTLLSTHFKHMEKYPRLAIAVSNPYMFIPNSYYDIVMPIGIAFTLLMMATIASAQLRFEKHWDAISIFILSTLVLALCPYFLPKILDRYFYAAALCSIPLAFIYWRAMPAALLLNIAALCYPFGFIPNPLDLNHELRQQIGVAINGAAILYLFIIWGWRLREMQK